MPDRLRAYDDARWALKALSRLWLTVAVVLGVLIIVGGRDRWSSSSFQSALTYPYAPASWGVALLLIGVGGIIGSLFRRTRVTSAALFGMSVWSVFFAMSFISTAATNPLAATTGIPMYLGAAVTSSVIAVAAWRVAPKRAVHR